MSMYLSLISAIDSSLGTYSYMLLSFMKLSNYVVMGMEALLLSVPPSILRYSRSVYCSHCLRLHCGLVLVDGHSR